MTIRYANRADTSLLLSHDRHVTQGELLYNIGRNQVLMLFEEETFAGWLRYHLFWSHIPFMDMLFFLEEYRGRGLGGKLTAFWESEMKAQGYKRVMTSSRSDERGQFFYRKHGYVDCGAWLLPGEPLEIFFYKDI